MSSIAYSELFNSPLETGVRSVVLLNEAYPKAFDLKELTWLDHLVVHTGDISGPDSLHPNVPHRDGELLVRRSLVEQGISLMRQMNMIEAIYGSQGVMYSASDQAGPFVKLMRTEYGCELKARAKWLISNVESHDTHYLRDIVSKKIGRWTVEFHGNIRSGDNK